MGLILISRDDMTSLAFINTGGGKAQAPPLLVPLWKLLQNPVPSKAGFMFNEFHFCIE